MGNMKMKGKGTIPEKRPMHIKGSFTLLIFPFWVCLWKACATSTTGDTKI